MAALLMGAPGRTRMDKKDEAWARRKLLALVRKLRVLLAAGVLL